MAITITTSQGEKTFNKDVINIGTNPNCDIVLSLEYDILRTVQYANGE